MRIEYIRWMVLMQTWLSFATNEDFSRWTLYSSVNFRLSSDGTYAMNSCSACSFISMISVIPGRSRVVSK